MATHKATKAVKAMSDPANPPARWRYGDAWERFPMRAGEVWRASSMGTVAVHNLFDAPLPGFMRTADTLFIDPPWTLGNLNSFYTKAGRADYQADYEVFARRLFACIAEIAPQVCYLEIGAQYATQAKIHLHDAGYGCVECWPVTYYRKHPCWLLRGGHTAHTGRDFTGMDEERCIEVIAREEAYDVLGDLCMGRGLVGWYAYRAGRPFVGTELNPRRLACLLDRVAKADGVVERISAAPRKNVRATRVRTIESNTPVLQPGVFDDQSGILAALDGCVP